MFERKYDNSGSSRGNYSAGPREMHDVTCSECGKQTYSIDESSYQVGLCRRCCDPIGKGSDPEEPAKIPFPGDEEYRD